MHKNAAVSLLCLLMVSCPGQAPAPAAPHQLSLASSHVGRARAHHDALVGRVRGTRAWHKGRRAHRRFSRRSVQENRPRVGNRRWCLHPESSARRDHADGAPLVLKRGTTERRLKWKDDVVAWTKHVADSASLDRSELVFVGYGVVAPEYNWDDYKGVDVTGKTIVMLINDPPVPDPANPSELDPKTFGGKAMTYYGRWTYKFEMAAEKHAAGAIIIHETGPAGYPFEVAQSSWTGEQFGLVTPDKNMGRANIEGWITLDAGKSLLKMAGQDFDVLKKRAATRDFKPVPLGVTASMTLHNTLRTIESRNVIAKLEGSDPQLKDEVRDLHGALGSSRHRAGGERRHDLQRCD